MSERMKTVLMTMAAFGAVVCLTMLCVVSSDYDPHVEGAEAYHGWQVVDVYRDSAAAYMILMSPMTHMKRRIRCMHGTDELKDHHHVGEILP